MDTVLIIYQFTVIILLGFGFVSPNPNFHFEPIDEYSVLDFHGDYSPPSPPPPPPSPHPPPLTCADLRGTGSLDATCELNNSLIFDTDVYIEGVGSLHVMPRVRVTCLGFGCSVIVNVSSEFRLGLDSVVVGGTVYVVAGNASFEDGSVVNVTALGGDPPEYTSGSPKGVLGGGGGHGGRGACCVVDNTKLPEDVWGGDAYGWSDLDLPFDYGSKGGTTSKDEDYGGKGGGRVRVEVVDAVELLGSVFADGGDGGVKGGGGSGGSIFVKAHKMTGSGVLSASGGNGFAGGAGGRISVDVFSRHDDQAIFAHGGQSYGCPANSGAAGTFYDAVPRRLKVNNHNRSTDTDTPFFAFPNQPRWTSVDIQDFARADVPLRWSRVQVQGQLSLSNSAVLSFGLPHDAVSEFELIAEELLMSDSVIKIYGALRMSVKLHLMLNSKMVIDGDGEGDPIIATSLLEASNLLVLKGGSVIQSNSNLGIHGQGSLNLTGEGNIIEAQHLVLSIFCCINVEPGSVVRGPLQNTTNNYLSNCELEVCPMELIHPPEDCNVNSSLSFTLQICRVEEIIIEGSIEGSVVHFQWVRTVIIQPSGSIVASGLGCIGGVGQGKVLSLGPSGGGGHGGRGGNAYYNNSLVVEGGGTYGDADFPCELGSGSGNDSLGGATAGGGIIVMGSLEHSLSSLYIYGSLTADGESFGENIRKQNVNSNPQISPGGGSGGSVLLFVDRLALGKSSTISTVGGYGGPNSGGGGGGRIHFHWSDITVGDEYQPVASVNGSINIGGGIGKGLGQPGDNGTITGISCPKGLHGIFCEECPLGTYKNVTGSERSLCYDCPTLEFPYRAIFTPVRGGVSDIPCPYKCVSERYHMPHCYTTFEELIYTFGGPWVFGFMIISLLVLFALVLSVARVKFVGGDELSSLVPARHGGLQLDRSVPFLESLNEVLETNRNEESRNHVHRMYFLGSNTFSEPWHLPHSPSEQVAEIVYEDAFNRFAEEINILAAYQWWEGSFYNILSIISYPFSWTWLLWCRKKKIQRLREFVRSEYDHACLRSCRSRALYEGLKVSATSDMMLAYVDFFLGGDEKRDDLPPTLHQRFPLSLVFGGDGSYMAPFVLHSDNILTSLMSQSVPSTVWYRLVAGLNAQLRLVRCDQLKSTFRPIISWLDTYANPTLSAHHIRVDLARFQPTASGYYQFGLIVSAIEDEQSTPSFDQTRGSPSVDQSRYMNNYYGKLEEQRRETESLITPHRRASWWILNNSSLQSLKENMLWYPLSFIICNVKPIGHQDLVGLVISILLLGDFILVLLMLLQLYSNSVLDLYLVLFITPLGILLPFPAGISALFSHTPKRSSGLARFYALWNITSLVNVVVAFICGYFHYKNQLPPGDNNLDVLSWSLSMDDGGWWMLPTGLMICKIAQAQLIDYHVANQEIQDRTLYCNDPNIFWQS
ncbi:uncharacterized protein LOC143569627 [Bidens hawaiensis]|uniref:uncharacterized protein LOC143569627 n=1 Tax=Bidens hawaiensis TaxID=980011 RepID=UPI004049632B